MTDGPPPMRDRYDTTFNLSGEEIEQIHLTERGTVSLESYYEEDIYEGRWVFLEHSNSRIIREVVKIDGGAINMYIAVQYTEVTDPSWTYRFYHALNRVIPW